MNKEFKSKEYVLGFAFDRDKESIILIEKQKPDWQKGKHNGVGGKVEFEDMSPTAAMVREFKEETGVDTIGEMWHHFATMLFKDDIMGGHATVFCFRMFSNVVNQCKTMETEQIRHFKINSETEAYRHLVYLSHQPVIKNLIVLIPMAMDEDFQFCELNIK